MDRIAAYSAVRLDSYSNSHEPRRKVAPPGTQGHPGFLERLRLHGRLLALAAGIVAGSVASPALAAREPSAKLVRCGEQSCLRVSGHRDNPASIVRINGYAVPAEGDSKWTVHLPVDVVREWSAPNARTIDVSIGNPEMAQETIASVDLPIGLLADGTVLASLVINVH